MVKELSTILSKGKPKQRITLYMDAVFSQNTPKGDPTLTDLEIDSIYNSFNSPEDIKYFNKHNKLNRKLILLCGYLQQLVLQFTAEMYQINGYTLIWHSYEQEEDLLNSILYDITDPKTKEKIQKKIVAKRTLMSKVVLQEDGFIKIEIGDPTNSEGYSLRNLVKAWAIRAAKTMSRAKANIQAIRKTVDSTGLNLKTVNSTLDEFEEQFSKDWAVIPKFSKYKIIEIGEVSEKAQEVFENYYIYPNYDEVEPNPEEYESTLSDLKEGFK